MKKTIILGSLFVAGSAFASPYTTATSAGNASTYVYEYGATNEIVLDNVVEVTSSRMNVWLCGLGIRNQANQTDNSMFFTHRTNIRKDDDVMREGGYTGRIEAPTDGSWAKFPYSTAADKEFRWQDDYKQEKQITNVRVNLNSLRHGAEMYVDVCGELPFAYENTFSHGGKKEFALDLTAYTSIVDIAKNHAQDDYIVNAGLQVKMEAKGTNSQSDVDVDDNVWTAISDLWTNVASGADFYASSFQGSASSAFSTTRQLTVRSANNGQEINNLKKFVVRYYLKETKTTRRLRGLAQGVQWRQYLRSNFSVQNQNGTLD